MKTIKFRGKRIDNGEWVYGYYYYKWRTKQHVIHCSESQGVLVDKEFEVIGETVEEFTGLKDKNRKDKIKPDKTGYEIKDHKVKGYEIPNYEKMNKK